MRAGTFSPEINASKSKVDLFGTTAFVITFLSVGIVIMGGLILADNPLERYAVPLLLTFTASFIILFFIVRHFLKVSRFVIMIVAAAALASAVIVMLLPAYMQGLNIHGIIHRSFVSGLLLLAVGTVGTCYSLYYFLRGTPWAFDISRYPIIILFAAAALSAYGLIMVYVVQNGASQLQWPLIAKAFEDQFKTVVEWQNGWPNFSTVTYNQTGLLHQITGTLMLMLLTSLISLPIGVSVGVFVHEYAGAKLGGIINFSTTALRSISGVILAVTAIDLLSAPKSGTFWYSLFHGFSYDLNGNIQYGRSSFLFASAFISLLVIPVIAKATQEGLKSLPEDVREGSLAIGASKDYTLFHIQLPWSLPNIITGLMLGCAEAAGALTIIFLIAGVGQYGVSPLNETTSLAYFIFDCKFWQELSDPIRNMQNYQYAAALMLLIITVGLTTAALILKNRLAKRYKGA